MTTTELAPQALHALRRVDWRFLLPGPAIGRVAVLTSPLADEPDDPLLAGLKQLTDTVELVSDTGQIALGQHDILVARNPTQAALRDATRFLGDDGLAYVELRRNRRTSRLGGFAAWQRILTDSGMPMRSAHWHHPSFDAAEIIPLSRASVRMALARRRGSLRGSLVAGAAARMPGTDVGVARAAPAVSLLAGPRRRAERVGSWLFRAGPPTDPAQLGDIPWLLVTPRFATSRHVVLVAGPSRGSAPWVAKTPRLTEDTGPLSHEAGILASLASRIGVSGAFPMLLSFEAGPPMILVETALMGRPLDPLAVRGDPARALRLGEDWARTVAAAAGPAEAGCFTARVREPLQRLADAPFAIDRDAISRAERILGVLDASQVPTVIEHGDMSHPNVVMVPGGLGLMDWELGTVDGLPLADLAFFIGYVAFATSRATTPEAHARALLAALASSNRWGMLALRAHAHELGLPEHLVGPLVLAAWTRYAASIGRRLASDDAAASTQVARFRAAWHLVLTVVEAQA